jgi:hypothetical protein
MRALARRQEPHDETPARRRPPGFCFRHVNAAACAALRRTDMNRNFLNTTEMHPGSKRPSDAIALCEDGTRALDAEEIF